MSASKKLATSVKALSFLAKKFPEPQQSAAIANYTHCNASKIRQLLSMMVKCGLVESIQGSRGGFTLKKSPEEMDLQEIYCAIEDQKAFPFDKNECETEPTKYVDDYFATLYTQIQIDIENKMKTITLESIIKTVSNE